MRKPELEKFYNLGLRLEKAGDIDGAERAYREALAVDPDDHGGVKLRLASLGRIDAPSVAPQAYIATLFDQTADRFDYILVNQLGYDVPNLLGVELENLYPDREFYRLLDLGCGTGLTGEALDNLAAHKTGVDISERMIEIADEKGDYDDLYVGDILQFLTSTNEKWDLITATDVFPYIGDLSLFFNEVVQHLETNGIFAFSTECLASGNKPIKGYDVGVHQRYVHDTYYLRTLINSTCLQTVSRKSITVRKEQGDDVLGELYVVQKKD